MGARVSAEMKHALALVREEGKSPYAAARQTGLDPSGIYKALNRKAKKKVKKEVDR